MLKQKLRSSYKLFKNSPKAGNWDKVQKRYFTLFGKLKDKYLTRYATDLLNEYPSVRESIFRYLTEINYSKPRLTIVENFLLSGHCSDIGSLFLGVKCLVSFNIPFNASTRKHMHELAIEIKNKKIDNTAFAFGASLIILAKYAESIILEEHIKRHVKIWENSAWASRQVAALTPRLSIDGEQKVASSLQSNGQLQGLQVLTHLDRLKKTVKYDLQLYSYCNCSAL